MGDLFRQLIGTYRCVSIIGMCKNAGKTTALNRIIRESAQTQRNLALTSIGRDGEDQDLVTGTKKPGIFIPEGTLVATASDLVVRHCDVTREILDTTGIFTPMGEVVIFRARSAGNVQLAGPSMTSQLAAVREDFFRLGADLVLIDGALSRKSLCSRQVTEATVLCTGASYHKNLRTVVEDTAYQCRILTLPEAADLQLQQLADTDSRDTLLFTENGPISLAAGSSLEEALRKNKVYTVFFGGALTDHLVKPLILSAVPLQGLTFVVRDASKILLKPDSFEKLQRRGVRLQVLRSVNLAAVTVNPFSAYGFHFDASQLLEEMRGRIDLPVIDVMEDGL